MKTILITGALGYIGSHTVVELAQNTNYNLILLDNLSNSDLKVLTVLNKLCNQNFKFYNLDCRENLNKIFNSYQIDGIMHFAAFKAVGDSVVEPLLYWDNNINSLINLLNYCQNFNVSNFIFSSSCSLYGNVEQLPVTEKTKLDEPQSPYAWTKLVGEKILSNFVNANPWFNATCLRYFNPVGAHNSGILGELTLSKPNNIMPIICNAAKLNKTITVFGDQYNTPDGTCIRDYIHVVDVANAHVLALNAVFDTKIKGFDIFNLGSERGYSVLEIINKFKKTNKINVKYEIGPPRKGDVVSIYSDSTKAKEILGWLPSKTIEEVVKSAWVWSQNNI
jgi:UDP-glucose 4-epimerase